MEKANILLALGGDAGNSVPKYDVTAAEVAVLRVIHGDDAVFDIEPTGTLKRTNREELARLTEIYGQRQPSGRNAAPAVAALFPGAAARVFEDFEELGLEESLFKPVSRASAKPSDEPASDKKAVAMAGSEAGLATLTVDKLKEYAEQNEIDLTGARKKDEILARIEEVEAERTAEQGGNADDDGVGDINDGLGSNVLE